MNLFGRRRPQSPDAACAKVIAILTDRFGALPMSEGFPMYRLPHRGFNLTLDWTHPRDDLWQLVVQPYSALVVALAEQDGVSAWNCVWRARWESMSRSLRVDVCTEKDPARMALALAGLSTDPGDAAMRSMCHRLAQAEALAQVVADGVRESRMVRLLPDESPRFVLGDPE